MTATIPRTRITVRERASTIVCAETRTAVVDRRPAVSVRVPRQVRITTGQQGPRGRSGAAGSGFDFTQPTAATVWTINHNLGLRPDVATYRLGGTEMKGAVQHLSDNTLTVTFNSPVAGYARVS